MNPAETLAALSAATQSPEARFDVTTTQGEQYKNLLLRSFSSHWQHNRALETYLSFLDDSREVVLTGTSIARMEVQKNWLRKKSPAGSKPGGTGGR